MWAAVSAAYSALLSSSYFERINDDDDDDEHAVDLLVLRYWFIECRCSWPHKYFEQTVGAAYPITPMHKKGALRNAATHQSVHPIPSACLYVSRLGLRGLMACVTVTDRHNAVIRTMPCSFTCARMCLLGVSLTLLPILGVKSPQNPNFWGVNRRFQAKRAKY